MSPRGVSGSRSGLAPGLRFGAVEDAAPLQRHPTTGPAASPDNGAPAPDGNDRLAAARTEEFTDLFREAVTEDFGAVARLHQMLETASEWCRTHGARGSASELDTIASRLTDLGEELHLVAENVDHEIRSGRTKRQQRPASRQRRRPGELPPASGTTLHLLSHLPSRARCRVRGEAPVQKRVTTMPTSPDSSATPDRQPQDANERAAWRARVQALASAADGIRQASDQWDAVSDSYCDEDGWPVDETGYADGKVTRDATAWEHVETFLAHGPEVLAGVRAAAQPADYLDGPISADLLRLRGIDSALERAGEIRREWDQVIALMEGSMPGSRELYEERAREIRNSEGWHYADELSYSGAALARAADHLADRIGDDQSAYTGRVQAALARSASGQHGASAASPPASAASAPPAVRRSR
ncbi:hypothetical protein [Streptomyces capillispiralis]|uniref:Uncharacterized protein n=1 Tax=Streptomyces capillispiralis TaxID=68182 RepID=A0A561TL33_9ACTN|nr:hypothetical protein [Streptomyces capillispiralis]TWF87866.1 hypothetical protein FHX78_114884 [Streptomyces capillispiralis]GHH96283.1 hypothetical protein GCM10017779_67400 [Streptomyces capillispiralis]